MAGVQYQGAIISGVKSGFDHTLYTQTNDVQYYQFTYTTPYVGPLEPELWTSQGTTTASITFKEVKTQTNAEDIQIHIMYELTKFP